ncbi:galactan beta-1,4-galactosyltransferase GALS1-like [Andrographis paniculata]|uniref:galactan beta-1,4-galactosyltransferase GALS1-like n=1 Tax=Andrographis paniculata TaxID=175694 RepID=UPI0021E88DDF|nr:galactan beta-1,4-galactosyltransferase GALS1-like [Andrographis paniculata]
MMLPPRFPPQRGGGGGESLHSRSLDSTRKGGTHSIGKAFICFDMRSFLGTLLALTVVMFVWKPYYESLLSARYRCSVASSSSISVESSTSTVEQEQEQELELVNDNDDPNNRTFRSYGSAADLFVQFGAYRGGANTFTVVGLASKPLHVYGSPWFKCGWEPNGGGSSIAGKAHKMLPDWGYGRVYTTVIVNCTFPENPNADNRGGKLMLYAYYAESSDRHEKLTSLEEPPGAYNESAYTPPYKYDYDYLYCGSSLYGNLSSDRIREWMAYHTWFFGPRSHFVFHNAGGVTPEVEAVLEPYVKAERVTMQDVRAQAAFDSYYYNQFVVVNDCLHRYRFAANWTFFFDVDEYIYIPDGNTLESVLQEFSNNTQFTIDQYPMSAVLCLEDSAPAQGEWGFEKLLFKDSRTHIWKDRKYAIQAKNAYATGIHMSENVEGGTLHNTETKIRYYHYHNAITVHDEVCRTLLPMTAMNATTWLDAVPYVYDDTMKKLAPTIKEFERDYMREIN